MEKIAYHPIVEHSFFIGDYKFLNSFKKSMGNSEDIVIKPGISFGFSHPATTIMLQLLNDEWLSQKKRALDIGCGSGILSIFLERKGLKKIYAIDIDPYIIKETIDNVKNNVCKKKVIKVLLKDIFFLKKPFDLIVANVPINVHMLVATHIKRLLKKKVCYFVVVY